MSFPAPQYKRPNSQFRPPPPGPTRYYDVKAGVYRDSDGVDLYADPDQRAEKDLSLATPGYAGYRPFRTDHIGISAGRAIEAGFAAQRSPRKEEGQPMPAYYAELRRVEPEDVAVVVNRQRPSRSRVLAPPPPPKVVTGYSGYISGLWDPACVGKPYYKLAHTRLGQAPGPAAWVPPPPGAAPAQGPYS
eukprot:tig00001130_g7233.t1